MEYILLVAGIVLVIYGLVGFKKKGANINPVVDSSYRKDSFDMMVLGSDVIRRLEIIEEKIDKLKKDREYSPVEEEYMIEEPVATQFNIKPEEVNDLNHQILRMQNDGMDVEEIANSLGLMKGEVLLRLGIKK